ncbi:MAG: site-specific integrase [Sediminibacterium sp.]|nr:site-specific integrase [Sediminibacterium sp.]
MKKLHPELKKHEYSTEREIEALNTSLAVLVKAIKEIEQLHELNKVIYSVDEVIERLKEKTRNKTKKSATSNELSGFLDDYITTYSETRAKGSLSVYSALKRHLEEYQKHFNTSVTFAAINYQFFEDFQAFLIKHRNLNNTTVAKQLSTVKTFLNYAKKRGVEVSSHYQDFKIKKEVLEVIALTNVEFELLFNLDLKDQDRLSKVRDIFCFACATGMRYSDLNLLRWDHIKDDIITFTVKKTKSRLTIPLNEYSTAILARYKGNPKPLPMITNQKLNDYLKGWEEKDKNGKVIKQHKGLCEIAGIDEPIEIVRYRGVKREANIYPKYKLIGVHTGRKTFVTLSLEKGMSAEQVMSITGHTDYKSFKRYVNITEGIKKVAMVKAWGNPVLKLKAV